jgi:glycosyltransferase involved in cell wall biosynthesis
VCCFYESYPPASGAASVSYNLAKFSSGSRVLLQLGSREERLVTTDNVQIVTLAGASQSRRERLARLPGFVNRMVAEIRRAEPEVAILEGASWALYHWMLLQRIRRAIPKTKIIYHSHNVEYLLRSQRHSRTVATLTRWAEGRLIKNTHMATAVSEVDQNHFARLYGVRPILLPNGVDVERFTDPDPNAVDRLKKLYRLDGHTLLFAGFYAYDPNREAIDFLVRSVMPALRERYPSATLALTGGGAPYHEPWIRNVGSIAYDDFAPFVAACGIAVAPIFSGSGTRLKILEAMAAGIPVLATEKAAEGLSLTHGEDILFAGDKDDFVRSLAELFENPCLAANVCERARVTIAKFSWQAIVNEFERALYSHRLKILPESAGVSTAV